MKNFLAQCIHDLCQCGFSPKQQDTCILDFVEEYEKINKVNCFKNGWLKIDWLNNFIKQNILPVKKANLLQNQTNLQKTHFLYSIGMAF